MFESAEDYKYAKKNLQKNKDEYKEWREGEFQER